MPRKRHTSSTLTVERLQQVLEINADGDGFTWKDHGATRFVGQPAGRLNTHGYLRVSIDRQEYMVHHLVWMHHYGCLPSCEIDHRDEVKTNNHISNLRESTRSEQMQNITKARSDSKSGIRGVTSKGSKWYASIRVGDTRYHLGSFDTPELAEAAYLAKKLEIHPAYVPAKHSTNRLLPKVF